MSWWAELYDDRLADVLLERADPAQTERTLDFLTAALDLAPGAEVFDQCCGIGSLAVPLARRGFEVIGADLMPNYIDRARAAAAGTSARFVAADAFEFVVRPSADAAFNWWTSFGYATDDATNLRMLACAFESLRPGGRFALDFMNAYQVVRGFSRDVVLERETARGPVTLWRRSRLEPTTGLIHKTWTYLLADGARIDRPSQVRLYFPHELVRLFQQAGFRDIELYGDLDQTALREESPRCLVVARRPERER